MDRKHWELIPSSSIGGLDFGRSCILVRKELGEPIRTIKKTANAIGVTDVYPSFHVYYAKGNTLEAIEFFGNDVSLSIDSQILFPGTLSEAKKVLPDLEESYGSYISKSTSIGIGVEGDTIVSVLVGCKDYYS